MLGQNLMEGVWFWKAPIVHALCIFTKGFLPGTCSCVWEGLGTNKTILLYVHNVCLHMHVSLVNVNIGRAPLHNVLYGLVYLVMLIFNIHFEDLRRLNLHNTCVHVNIQTGQDPLRT